jgi:hypothetical protein
MQRNCFDLFYSEEFSLYNRSALVSVPYSTVELHCEEESIQMDFVLSYIAKTIKEINAAKKTGGTSADRIKKQKQKKKKNKNEKQKQEAKKDREKYHPCITLTDSVLWSS